jgi:hypothetical protein
MPHRVPNKRCRGRNNGRRIDGHLCLKLGFEIVVTLPGGFCHPIHGEIDALMMWRSGHFQKECMFRAGVSVRLDIMVMLMCLLMIAGCCGHVTITTLIARIMNRHLILAIIALLSVHVGCRELTPQEQERATRENLLNVASQFNLKKGFHIIEGQCVYLDSNASEGRILRFLPDADGKTFRAFEQTKEAYALYAADAKNAYVAMSYHVYKISDADGSTFEVLTPKSGALSRDSKHVYYQGVALNGADPKSFIVLEKPFGKDSQNAFIGTVRIPVKDLPSWKPLQDGFFDDGWPRSKEDIRPKDESKVYATGWSRDSSTLYYGNRPFSGADVETFVVLSSYYSKDKNHVFFADKIIVEADPSAFEVHDGPYIKGTKIYTGGGPDAHDSNYEYRSGKIYSK